MGNIYNITVSIFQYDSRGRTLRLSEEEYVTNGVKLVRAKITPDTKRLLLKIKWTGGLWEEGKTKFFLLDNIKLQSEKLNTTNENSYYPFGMSMPNMKLTDGQYRYGFQGQESDPETGKEAFQLRLWDSRIGRWLTTDPYGQHASPYLGMGNNPITRVDPDGGLDRYKLGKDGKISYYDDKGGDTVDYLFTEGDMTNEIRITDTSILPQLEGNSIFQQSYHNPNKILEGSYAISGNNGQVKRLYEWIGARNSKEWTYIRANTGLGRKSFIGTLRSNDQGLNPSPGRGGFGGFSIMEHSHTHFGTALHDFQPSGADMNNAARVRQNSPNAKFSIYSPLITKNLYNNVIKGRVDANTMKPKYKPLRHEPSTYISY